MNLLKKLLKNCCCNPIVTMADESSGPYCQEAFQEVTLLTNALQDELSNYKDDLEKRKELIRDFLKGSYKVAENRLLGKPRYPIRLALTSEYQWVNAKTERVSFDSEAAGNLLIFDFFTHCCINCIHSIEDLREVYEHIVKIRQPNNDSSKFQCGFKLFSIHSPKFSTEKELESIKSSVARMHMDHTQVLNDPKSNLWQKFGLYCWPTVLVFGPNVDVSSPGPNLLFAFTGEGHKELLQTISEVALDFFDQKISESQVQVLQESLKGLELLAVDQPTAAVAKSDEDEAPFLSFPGKVTVFGDIVCISDSGNNRIVIANIFGEVKHIIGGTDRGYVDGPLNVARFGNPQGTAFVNSDVLFVADTGNHCIRMVDLSAGRVSTLVAPTPRDRPGTKLKSPWDLSFYDKDILLVACAGNHQIYGYFFAAKTLFRLQRAEGAFDLIAGTGKEENRNNAYILRSSFAQPSGIFCSGDDTRTIFIADSESSSVRMITTDGKVAGVVGGNRDPTDLFSYGDEDGIAFDVRLQHPMGVCAPHPGKIYVADTYNHKIKKVKVETKHCTTLIGDGAAGNQLGSFTGNAEPKRLGITVPSSSLIFKELRTARLNEPGGINIDAKGEYLFIADTNNHAIKVAHLKHRIVSELKLKTHEGHHQKRTRSSYTPQPYQLHTTKISRFTKTFRISFVLDKIPRNFDGGKMKLTIPIYNNSSHPILNVDIRKETVHGTVTITTDEIPYVPWLSEITTVFHLMFCGKTACYRKLIKLKIVLDPIDAPAESSKVLTVDVVPPQADFFAEAADQGAH